jgi:hypothetical protein
MYILKSGMVQQHQIPLLIMRESRASQLSRAELYVDVGRAGKLIHSTAGSCNTLLLIHSVLLDLFV